MRTTDAVIIGAGQAGLAMSHCLGGLAWTEWSWNVADRPSAGTTERWTRSVS